jgi:hypothetical protein
MLRLYREYAKAFIDDFIIFNIVFILHSMHFRAIFKLYIEKRIYLKPAKTYLNFFNVQLLKQYVDFFRLLIIKDKLAVIR